MNTMELTRQTKQAPEDISRESITLALGILVQRIQALPQEDKEELCELLKELPIAEDHEELNSIMVAMREILDQQPIRIRRLDQSDDVHPRVGLQGWMDFVSARIRALRKAADLTQEELAAKSGLPQSHISRLEAAKHSPSRVTLEKIANALGVHVGEFDASR